MSNLNLKGIWIPIEILTDNKLSDKEKFKDNKYNNKNINNKYNSNNKIYKKNKADFEERDYTGYDFTKLYANADILIKE